MEDFALKYIDSQIRKSERTSNRQWYYYLNGKLIKAKKPCFDGDYIHLKSIDGCFKVNHVTTQGIFIKKRGGLHMYQWEDFRCLKGEGISEFKLLRETWQNVKLSKLLLQDIESKLRKF